MTLTAALKSVGMESRVDADVADRQVVLFGEDRSIVPLLSDEASRALFLDERLRGKRAELHGTRFAGVPYVRVSTFRIEWEGRLETPEYFCTVCSISVGFPQICPCCQGSMELRMKPDRQ